MANPEITFTRYLYLKDEVYLSLLVSILNKSDDAVFWAYEIYYSGLQEELLDFIWKIYYDFFATLNPSFEAYFLKKHKELLGLQGNKERLISSLIQDLLFRPFNTDVFLLRKCCDSFEIDIVYHHGSEIISDETEFICNMEKWIDTNDYRSIAQWILNINKNFDLLNIYNICFNIFEKMEAKLTTNDKPKEKDQKPKVKFTNTILLAKIMTLFSKKAQLKKGKSIYINVEPEDIIPYETITNIQSYKVLEKAYICGINDLKQLSLFKLKRDKYNKHKEDLKEKYWHNWEYYASYSPIWLERINQFQGVIDHTKKKVVFQDDDLMDEFYELYGYEPDEQKQSVQNKSIMDIEKLHDWKWFYSQYRKNGLFEIWDEEIEEFDAEGLLY